MPIPLVSTNDLLEIAALFASLPLSWAVSDRHWREICAPFGPLIASAFPRRTRRLTAWIQHATGADPETAFQIEADYRAGKLEQRLQLLREKRPEGWNPEITLTGMEHVEAALTAGRGAILWCCPALFGGLVSKMAFAHAGHRVSHLSLYSHGLLSSRFGIRFVNPIQIRAEDRLLRERIVLPDDGSLAFTRKMERRLRGGELLSITVLALGRSCLTVPFFGREIRLPTGPASLSLLTGAPLLPVFTRRHGEREFETIVEPPHVLPDGRPNDEVIESVLREQARYMEARALAEPSTWMWGLWGGF